MYPIAKQRFLVVFSLLISMLTFMAPKVMASELGGALCVINVDGNIVLVKEKITNTWSLPGGTVFDGESPEDTAIRETWEEAGLVVSVVKPLGVTDTARIFECRSESDVVAFKEHNEFGGYDMPVWFAPHFDIEVTRAMHVDPNGFDASLYRLPEYWGVVKSFFASTTPQPVTSFQSFANNAPALHQFELNWLMDIHQLFSFGNPELHQSLTAIANGITVLTSPYFALLLVVFYYGALGHKSGLRLAFTVSITMLMGLIAQYGFKWASPAVFFYIIDGGDHGQYSFPNLTAMLLCAMYPFLSQHKERTSVQVYFKLFPAGMVVFMLAQFFVGMSFISDFIVGSVLGYAISSHLQTVEEKRQVDLDNILASSVIWWVLALVAGGASLFWTTTTFSVWVAILCTLGVIAKWSAMEFNGLRGIPMLFMTVAAGLFIACLNLFAPLVAGSSLGSLLLTTISYPLVIVLVLFMCLRKSN